MTAFRYLALSGLICGLLASSAFAAPIATTSGEWWWWSPTYAELAANNSSAEQFANAFYGPASTSSAGTTPVLPANYVPSTAGAIIASASASTSVAESTSSTPTSTPVANSTYQANANLNLGTGPYALASTITTGNAQPWYNSSQISSFFGGQPTSQQITSFDNTVYQRVEQAFRRAESPSR